MIDTDLLTFDGAANPPAVHSPIVRDDNDVLIAGNRSCNANGEWEIRSYRVYGHGVVFRGLDVEQTELAAVLVGVFDGDELTTDDRYAQTTPVRHGVPVAVAVDGKPAVAAWLRVRGHERDEIADVMDVGRRTVREYLSRFRRRGDGLPADTDVPPVGSIMSELPPEFDYSGERQQIADGSGGRP